jgi:hypothetical protein
LQRYTDPSASWLCAWPAMPSAPKSELAKALSAEFLKTSTQDEALALIVAFVSCVMGKFSSGMT